MYNLPRRDPQIVVRIPGVDGLELHFLRLTPSQFTTLNDGAEVVYGEGGEVKSVRFPLADGVPFFFERLLAIPGLTIGEEKEPFDRLKADHTAAIPTTWIPISLSQLFRAEQEMQLTKDDRGNLPRPAARSPKATGAQPA
jgi:hypothetical protein